MESEEQDYKNAMRAFYRKYNEMRKIYNMRLYCASSVNSEMKIKIYRETMNGRTVVIDVQEAEETQCYKRALEELKSYETVIA